MIIDEREFFKEMKEMELESEKRILESLRKRLKRTGQENDLYRLYYGREKSNNLFVVLRDFTDEELDNMTDEELFNLYLYYEKYGIPFRETVEGLLDEYYIEHDGLTDFILSMQVGICNYANRSDNQICICRKDSKRKHNIIINLDETRDVPDVRMQIRINDDFIRETAYTKYGLELYRS